MEKIETTEHTPEYSPKKVPMVNNRIAKFYDQVDIKMDTSMDTNPKYRIVFERFDPRIIQSTVAHSVDLDEDGEADGYVEAGKLQKLIISQDNQLLKTINFWIGHLNFYLTPELGKTIERTEGIESLDVITPYRFRIGIGKLFSEKEVKACLIEKIYKIVSPKKS